MDPQTLFKESSAQTVATTPLINWVSEKKSNLRYLCTYLYWPDRPALINGIGSCPLTDQWYHGWAQSGSMLRSLVILSDEPHPSILSKKEGGGGESKPPLGSHLLKEVAPQKKPASKKLTYSNSTSILSWAPMSHQLYRSQASCKTNVTGRPILSILPVSYQCLVSKSVRRDSLENLPALSQIRAWRKHV